MMLYIQFLLVWIILYSFIKKPFESKNPEIKFVAVVFRHGDHTPSLREMFPNDLYINNTFPPLGYGELTDTGKKRVYELGAIIRQRYNDFLGAKYYSNIVMGRSTNVQRTKSTLQLVMDGLFPPEQFQLLNQTFYSQLIPVNVTPLKEDYLMLPPNCQQYKTEIQNVLKLPEVIERIEKFYPLMNKLTNYTGKIINTPRDMVELYHTFMAESAMGLTLLPWAYEIFPNGLLHDGAGLWHKISSYNNKLKRLTGGMLLKNILENMNNIANGNNTVEQKINLFSGHDFNIASLLVTLNIYTPHVPEYGSAIFFELLTDHADYYVKIYYYLGIPSTTIDLKLPGCDNPCRLEDFKILLKDVLPFADEMRC